MELEELAVEIQVTLMEYGHQETMHLEEEGQTIHKMDTLEEIVELLL
jgi:hypothetical protein